MPNRLSARIALAFATVAVATLLAVGGTLFVALRALHTDAASAALAQTSQPLVVQLRAAGGSADVRTILANLRDATAGSDLAVYLVTADGRVIDLSGQAMPIDPFPIDPTAGPGVTRTGTIRFADGRQHVYAATTLRRPAALGPRAIVLAQLDQAGAEALRDLARTLPIVLLLSLLVGAPIALVLARSVTGPLQRLAAATADLPVTAREPLPLEGPIEVQELTTRFNAMAAELAATSQRETRLLADLRHDLRTPLTVIGGFAAALSDGTATGDDATRASRAIAEEAARMDRLVAELDALERLHGGADGLRPERLDAGQLVAETVDRFGPAAAVRGIALGAAELIPANTELIFTADRLAVERVLGNLVDNALAAVASPGGHVQIGARLVPDAGPLVPAGIAFVVTDDGPGFAPGDSTRAFQRFYRGDPSRPGGGTGLGLAIVRELARAHGGDAYAENMAPRGARLSARFPVTPPPPPG